MAISSLSTACLKHRLYYQHLKRVGHVKFVVIQFYLATLR